MRPNVVRSAEVDVAGGATRSGLVVLMVVLLRTTNGRRKAAPRRDDADPAPSREGRELLPAGVRVRSRGYSSILVETDQLTEV
jgi:hypothetical protein